MRTPDALPPKTAEDTPQGLAYALTVYSLWGFLPLYMKLLDHMPAAEVVAHRVLWSVPISMVVLLVLRRTDALRQALRDPRMLAMGGVTAVLISINWGIYVWAISAGKTLDAALGYYMNPLFSIFLAFVLLGEKLSRAQWVAIALAGAAVAVLAVDAGGVPWVAIGLMFSWGFYALAKKQLPIGPNQGFALEVLLLTLPCVGYLAWLTQAGDAHFSFGGGRDMWLLMGCGVVTAVPLLIYANAAKRLRLSTIGILQYIAPTMIFLVAVFVFEEPFGTARAIAFPMIWAGLVIYSVSMVRQMKAAKAG